MNANIKQYFIKLKNEEISLKECSKYIANDLFEIASFLNDNELKMVAANFKFINDEKLDHETSEDYFFEAREALIDWANNDMKLFVIPPQSNPPPAQMDIN